MCAAARPLRALQRRKQREATATTSRPSTSARPARRSATLTPRFVAPPTTSTTAKMPKVLRSLARRPSSPLRTPRLASCLQQRRRCALPRQRRCVRCRPASLSSASSAPRTMRSRPSSRSPRLPAPLSTTTPPSPMRSASTPSTPITAASSPSSTCAPAPPTRRQSLTSSPSRRWCSPKATRTDARSASASAFGALRSSASSSKSATTGADTSPTRSRRR